MSAAEISSNPTVWVICAAYNEATTIGRVVTELDGAGYRVVVVDDGSGDGTRHIAAVAGADVVVHPVNLGQGAALQTGIDYALSQGADILVTFDADGQHRVADIPVLLDALRHERAEFALGSRFLGQTYHLPALRRWILYAATIFTRLTTGLRLTDSHNGLRALTRRGAAAFRLRQNRMAHASEILVEIAHSGLRYVEVPVTIEYTAYSLAKGQRIGDSVTILLDLFAQELYR
jgi:glycosyltransferase involved in cell wall biosynthesis